MTFEVDKHDLDKTVRCIMKAVACKLIQLNCHAETYCEHPIDELSMNLKPQEIK